METKMRQIKVEKVTLNFGAGKDQAKLEKGLKLLRQISGMTPVKTITKKRIPAWGLRPGLPIGAKVTIRRNQNDLIKRLLHATDFRLKESNFDNNGNVSFGIKEYIDVEGAKYEPEIGIIGMEACVTLQRPGFRVKRRRLHQKSIHKRHKIGKEDAMKFMVETFSVKLGEE
jgi:large subunit ribosomal protein L5